jgi:medium-chain acyl-[acyl-carrier-protein] hydrolase
VRFAIQPAKPSQFYGAPPWTKLSATRMAHASDALMSCREAHRDGKQWAIGPRGLNAKQHEATARGQHHSGQHRTRLFAITRASPSYDKVVGVSVDWCEAKDSKANECDSPKPSTMRLFCIPHAGGLSAMYRGWSQALGRDFPITAVELPGHGSRGREPAATSMPDLVDQLISDLEVEMGEGPFAMFGHSLGGMISFQLTHELISRGLAIPDALFLSAARPPSSGVPEPLHLLPDAELIETLAQLNVSIEDPVVLRELIAFTLPLVRIDLTIAQNWRFTSNRCLGIPVGLFSGREDSLVPPSVMDRWRTHICAEVSSYSYRGGHFYLLDNPEPLLRDMQQMMYRIRSTQARPLKTNKPET